MNRQILTLSCLDRPGIVAEVASLISGVGGNIVESSQFNDPDTARFFMRVQFDVDDGKLESFRTNFDALAGALSMANWSLRSTSHRSKVLILVSKFDHCLVDLLYRWRINELQMDVIGVISNHPRDSYNGIDLSDVPFHYLPITSATKASQEEEIKYIVESSRAELVVLARYMQILSDDIVAFLTMRCINIHHSFLPGFKGARPYHQAFSRGVKMIGATAHYVTADLDEGPIIYQDVEPITHADSPDDLISKGRDIERRVMATAVQFHLENRVLLNGTKTVVFRK